MKDTLQLTDISTAEGQMVHIDPKDLPEIPGLDLKPMPWRPFTEEQKEKTACILDEVCVLNIPKPANKQEEEELAKEKRVQQAMLTIKKKFGKNAILKGMNLEEGATAKDRNAQIGGHKA